jgi:bis(5'-nucleosyl)-tetraphosphatase (symmetrical)
MTLQDPAATTALSAPTPQQLSGAAPQTPFAIGDVQGCCDALLRLLEKLDAQGQVPLWFVGDLVNRGPDSLSTLRKIKALGPRATAILGNHDLHLLAVFAGSRKQKTNDTLDQILLASDAPELITWLRHRPLAHFDGLRLMVHAGVIPQWDVSTTLALAGEIETQLRSPDWRAFIAELFANPALPWRPELTGIERLRAAASVLTRIRLCDAVGVMDTKYSGPPAGAPPGFMPWFDVPGRKTAGVTVVFGHWASLGLLVRDDVCAIDTGCVWGNRLSALPVDVDLNKRIAVQVTCAKNEAEKSSSEARYKRT